MTDIGIDFLKIKRAILHRLIERTYLQPHATTETSDELIELDQEVEEVIKKRIVQAAGKESKSFILDVKDDGEGTFFEMATTLFYATDEYFIEVSKEMCDLFAEKHTRLGLRGGYFILIEGYNVTNNFPILIVIKAETQEVLQETKENDKNILKVLSKVFLSPAQKLFKIGILAQLRGEEDGTFKSTNFKGLLFDSQFSGDSDPAEYFYKEFLGYELDGNDKVRTRDFYNKSSDFIRHNFSGLDCAELIAFLKSQLLTSQQPTISPFEIRETIFSDNLIKDAFIREIESQFPATFVKNLKLLDNKLRRNSLEFENNIKVSGPQLNFATSVEVVSDLTDITQEEINNGEYTIVKIKGTIHE